MGLAARAVTRLLNSTSIPIASTNNIIGNLNNPGTRILPSVRSPPRNVVVVRWCIAMAGLCTMAAWWPLLLDVVNHCYYRVIPNVNPNRQQAQISGPMVPDKISILPPHKNNLVAFLQTLTGVAVYRRTMVDPFNANGSLSVVPWYRHRNHRW